MQWFKSRIDVQIEFGGLPGIQWRLSRLRVLLGDVIEKSINLVGVPIYRVWQSQAGAPERPFERLRGRALLVS
jgi:hypothetical protein